ncbi:Retron-type reverse transcriptase [Candidatus Magnetomorum sp. HK-1]|nr:Retron-type reverse transcriptase [Candidatus Magnetomorum sp. HK-1]
MITYSEIHKWDNLLLAHRYASKGKRGKKAAASFEFKLEDNLLSIQDDLFHKTYQPSGYSNFYIHEPKRRLISAAIFRDRVVHHALCNIISPFIEKSFIHDSYANRVGKGTHRAIAKAQEFSRKYEYVLPCDIRQFFPSMDHEVLHAILSKKIKDPDILWLINIILKSGKNILKSEYTTKWFPGDDLLAVSRPRGLPIGNLTSQFWANCYLNPIDHFIKRELRCCAYLRFADDMLLFDNQKKELWHYKNELIKRLMKFRLTIHENSAQVRPVTEGIPFLGFLIYPNKKRLKRRKGIYYARKFKSLAKEYNSGKIPLSKLTASAQGWAAHASHGDTKGLRRSILSKVKLLSRHTIQQQCGIGVKP